MLIVIITQELSESGHEVETIWDNICDIIVKTVITIQASLASTYRTCHPFDYSNNICFEILGFDIILDSNCKPWLLEVNHSPSFSTDSGLDTLVKTAVIKDALVLVDALQAKSRKQEELARCKREGLQRVLSRKRVGQVSREEKNLRRKKEVLRRDLYEETNCGKYIKIYPGNNDEYYQRFVKASETGFNKLATPKRSNSISFRENIHADEDFVKNNEPLSNITACLAKRRVAWS